MPKCGKISIIGAGNVGASVAQRVAEGCPSDIVLVDVVEGLPQGKALDIRQSAPVLGFGSRVSGSNDYADTAGSDLVVITAGIGRKPGMTRDELIHTNKKVLTDVTHNVVKHSPDCIIIIVTNPVDAMTYLAHHVSGFPRQRVLGLSGVLDGARLGSFIVDELGAAPSEVETLVIGEHGQHMVVLPRLCKVKGKPLTELLPEQRIYELIERTIGGGAEIVSLLKTGSAYYAPSASVARMVKAIVFDEKAVMPCSAVLDGEYGFSDVALGLPLKLGENGIEEIVRLDLEDGEKKALADAAGAVKKTIDIMKLGLWE